VHDYKRSGFGDYTNNIKELKPPPQDKISSYQGLSQKYIENEPSYQGK